MYLFRDDYSEGAHPRILDALTKSNLQQEIAYGSDSFSKEAESLIIELIKQPKSQVHLVPTGTAANLICLSSMLKPYESVIMADTGHPNVHEAGAIEATGHKINIVPNIEGRIEPEALKEIVSWHTDEHMVHPKVVFVSQATELGTLYSKKQLEKISEVCRQLDLYLHIDGARIGNALVSKNSDCDIETIAKLSDTFYIGGTKNGALFGEAIVINNPLLQQNFRYHIKQRGSLLAKMRSIGVQFLELFKDGLYFENADHANKMAQKIAEAIRSCDHVFLNEPCTNQIFPILSNRVIKELEPQYAFYIWKSITDDKSAIRLCTSWATPVTAVDNFIKDFKATDHFSNDCTASH